MDRTLDERGLDAAVRRQTWESVDHILDNGPARTPGDQGKTGLALGYVQSGKTTSITALIAAAADDGYRVVIAFLGSTNLLLSQNQARLHASLGLGGRSDYRWVLMPNPAGAGSATEMQNWLGRDRTILVPVLKHAGRISSLANVMQRVTNSLGGDLPVLIVDDEADQASLNTQVSLNAQSRVYQAVTDLRNAVPNHLYVQYTATPYAPLLLEDDDHLRPDFIELLQPGPGYTGGREFFVDHADVVVRSIPTLDEQRPKSLPTLLPRSLITAFGNFVAGSALLLGLDDKAAPVSMLIHSTQRNDVQSRYRFLLDGQLRRWREQAGKAITAMDLPVEVIEERSRITALGAPDLSDADFLERVRYVLRETTIWLINSASDINQVDWNVAPVHVLVGGNKLDRGFTVEGLTVTYMNRPASEQLDTLEQRARAFGYRGDLLPYCQFFATPRTLKVLREIVDTEYDLRAQLADWLDEGRSISDWAKHIGLLMPEGTRPTRQAVISTLARFNESPGWHQLRRPSLDAANRSLNEQLVAALGLHDAGWVDYGRLLHRTQTLPLEQVRSQLLDAWAGAPDGSSPGWRHSDLVQLLERLPNQEVLVPVILMQQPNGGPRSREWDSELGFINLMQGRDPGKATGPNAYPGDRAIGGVASDPELVVVQVHHVQSSQPGVVPPLYTLAVHAGRRHVIRKGNS